MGTDLLPSHRRLIEQAIREKYAKVSECPDGQFRYPTGRAGLEKLGYCPETLDFLPPEAMRSYCGVGNPFSLGPVERGESVLDIGCGTGVDTLVAATKVGADGRAVGIDMTWEMLAQARASLRNSFLENVAFQLASAEDLPFRDESFHVAISNGVFNLIPDKLGALKEVFRVLKSGGHLFIADQILTGQLPQDPEARLQSWFR